MKQNHYIFLIKLTLLVLSGQLNAFAQNSLAPIQPSVLGAAGGSHSIQAIGLEWTVGESFVESVTLGKRWYTQGFHQPLLYISAFGSKDQTYAIRIFPNPAHEDLFLHIQNPPKENLNLQLMDVTGRVVHGQQLPAGTAFWNMPLALIPEGIYLLSVMNTKGYRIDSFKIIKL